MKWFDFIITKLTICIIFGIVTGYYFPVSLAIIAPILLVLFTILVILFVISNNQFFQKTHFGISVMVTAFCLGIFIECLHDVRNEPTHYTQFTETANSHIRIHETLSSSAYYDRYIGKVLRIDQKKASGKVLLYVRKHDSVERLAEDMILYVSKPLETITKSLNPSSFDYKSYLTDRYIYKQLHVDITDFIVSKQAASTLNGNAAHLRRHIRSKLVANGFTADDLAVIEALLLGQRQHISKTLETAYADAGAIHLLAISGLHIGIIVLLLQFVLRPLERLPFGKLVKALLMIAILWSFAFISGMSASVVRAVTMFTAVVIALHMKRETNSLQVVTVSMFFLLLCKPHFLFDVGFQLSYAAVFAILLIQPLWEKLWHPKSRLLNAFWSLFTVSLSAQLGVLPLSLYYFNQFPGLFFVANLTIIPVMGIILGIGILVIFLAYFDSLPTFIATFYQWIISNMNEFISWIASFETFVHKNIAFSLLQMIGCYVLISALIFYGYSTKRKHFKIVLLAVLGCQLCWFFNKTVLRPKTDTFMVFHQSRHTILARKHKGSLELFHNLDSSATKSNFIIKEQQKKAFLTTIRTDSLRNVYRFSNKFVLRIDSLGIYNVPNFVPDFVLLTDSPKINLQRMIRKLRPEMIIADGSNYKSFVRRWEVIAAKEKIPFHYTGEKGFYQITYQNDANF